MKNRMMALCLLLIIPMIVFGQSYDDLWGEAEHFSDNDLPKSEHAVLMEIVQKAEKEKDYGQLLKAELRAARAQCLVSPDSMTVVIEQLEKRCSKAEESDPVLHAVCCAVLGYIYENNLESEDRDVTLARNYYAKAMAHPELLAAVKTDKFNPLVVMGDDSKRFFADDLLSVMACETGHYAEARDYYVETGNRKAALMTSLWAMEKEISEAEDQMEPFATSARLQQIDSLINTYDDLEEVAEVALMRYEFMQDHTDATVAQKWNYIDEALRRWGKWPRMDMLRNIQKQLSERQYNVEFSSLNIPQRPLTAKVTGLRGIEKLTLRVYKVDVDGEVEDSPNNSYGYKKLKPLLHALPEHTKTHDYAPHQPYEFFEDSIEIDALPMGVYMIETETKPAVETSRTLYFVSNLRVLVLEQLDHQMRYVAVNATTGQPVKDAKIRLYFGYGNSQTDTILTTNAKGEVLYDYFKDKPRRLFAFTNDDKYCPPFRANGGYEYYDGNKVKSSTSIFTDRGIYRPGQKVHVAGILYKTTNGLDHVADANRKVTIRLRDANYQEVGQVQVTTDSFGTCAADFDLPLKGLTGNYVIQLNGYSKSIRVEEYKRPTFEVEMPEITENYADGDTVRVVATARSYAGVPVQGAKVTYTVERRRAYWWMSYSRYWGYGIIGTDSEDKELLSGEAVTDGDGHFTVDVPMVLPKTKYPMFYNFVVTAEVTDQGGETHHGELALPLGNRKTALSCSVPEKVLAEKLPSMTFTLRNAAGNNVPATVRYRISLASKEGNPAEGTANKKVSWVTDWMEVQSGTPVQVPKLNSGQYRVVYQTAASTDDEVAEGESSFIVFSLNDKRPAVETDDWFYVSDNGFPNDGKPVTLQVGSSANNMHIVYAVFANGQLLESSATDLSNALINRKFTYKEEYGDGLLFVCAWAKNGKVYSHKTTIKRPLPDKKLKLKWETFRDRLTPGQKEEWTLSVMAPSPTGKTGDVVPANAQLMATLYDKSLDQLAYLNWSLRPSIDLRIPYTQWYSIMRGNTSCSAYAHYERLSVLTLDFSHLDYDAYPSAFFYGNRPRIVYKALGTRADMDELVPLAAPMAEMESETKVAVNGAVAKQQAMADSAGDVDEEEELEEDYVEQPVQMRENLNETAFFYPQLVTDSEGRVVLKFTLPESLTTWNFLGLAHTTDMMYGTLEGEAVAQKDVMIQPNMPRFVRQGDKATIAAKVINTTSQRLSGTARLQLLDPETEKVVYEREQRMEIAGDTTLSVSFAFSPDKDGLSDYSLLICRMSISGATFSDGEQHYLPILSNKERVTVSVPFTQIEPGTKKIDLSQIIPQTSNLKPQNSNLTVEYTNNPAWLMIQALPAVGHPHDGCAICQASSFYANSIGKYIIDQNPTAKHVFEMWKQEETSQLSSLTSQLEKNQELKELLLNETPWVLDAKRETEQRHQLGDFFDENLMTQRIGTAVEKLSALQNGEGAWSWWPDMPSSFYITVEVSEMLVRLNAMTAHDSQSTVNSSSQSEAAQPNSHLSLLSSNLDKAFSYMGSEIVKTVEEMKQAEKKGYRQYFPTYKALQWLYICAIDGRQLPAKVKEANDYLIKLLKKDTKRQTIYEKAMSAIILEDKTYIKSLLEYTVYKEDMGRYYDTPRAGYSWRDYRIPTQVAAIEAIKWLTPNDTKTIMEMQRWLLQEKHTQSWDTPVNSVDAIYAFLNGNSQVLAPQEKTLLKVDGQAIETSEATAGIGYVKTTMPAVGVKEFTAEKTSTGTSWGAVYAQFIQQTSDITDQQSGLSVKREMINDKGEVIDAFSPLTSQPSPLKVGSRVKVRLTIVADRDYDFVQVIDKRPACFEPVNQISGYNWRTGCYCTPRDATTNYYFDVFRKGKHVVETEYYVDRAGIYETGTCVVECAYAPEFRALTKSQTIEVKE